MRDKEEIERTNTSVLMTNAFETGEILKASEETLQKYLQHLCTGAIPNENVRHRAIIQALTINHLQMQRHIDKLNRQNTFLTWVVIVLMAVTIAAMGYQIYQGQSYQALPQQAKKQELSPPTAQNPSPPISAPFQESATKVAPSKTEPPQTTSQTPLQNTSQDSGTLSKTNRKDQKPLQPPPYEKKK